MEECMRVTGTKTYAMVEVTNAMPIITLLSENSKKVSLTNPRQAIWERHLHLVKWRNI